MRLFGRVFGSSSEQGNSDRFRAIEKRLDELADDMEHLGRRFTKLQGQVTRSWRDDSNEEEFDDEFSEEG